MKNIISAIGSTRGKILCLWLLLATPILLYLLPLLLTGNSIAPGDADYQFQISEAFRRTVLEYHQFPWWNPWISGGTPLYANVQFGLVSLQSLLVLPFGAVIGFKLAILGYYLIGFFGFRLLLKRVFLASETRAILLAYIWVFGTFLAYRLAGGHFTFLMIQYFPWAFYFYKQRSVGKNWLYLAFALSLMLLGSPHYMTIMSFVVLALFFVLEILRVSWLKNKVNISASINYSDIRLMSKVMLVVVMLTAHRLYYAFAYLSDYPRNQLMHREVFPHLSLVFHAIAWPFNQVKDAPALPVWSWLEVSAYIGFATFIALLIVLFSALIKRKGDEVKNFSGNFTFPIYILLCALGLFLVMGLGEFSKFSPFYIFRRLPLFGSMRVSPRWFAWASMITLFIIAAYKSNRYQKLINVLLLISIVELFFIYQPLTYENYKFRTTIVRPKSAPFEQQRDWQTTLPRAEYDRNLLEATYNNYGQIIADDALIDTRFMPTSRCDVDEGCPFVTANAYVKYWSPNKIILTRIAEGPIKVNMNPSNGWMVNGKYTFENTKTVDTSQDFIIHDPSEKITIQYAPNFSLGWFKSKL